MRLVLVLVMSLRLRLWLSRGRGDHLVGRLVRCGRIRALRGRWRCGIGSGLEIERCLGGFRSTPWRREFRILVHR